MDQKPVIHYLNTDLVLICEGDAGDLLADLRARELYVLVDSGGGRTYLNCSGFNHEEPEPDVVRFLDAIDALSGKAREQWGRCSQREFNIGYDCGDEPWSFNQGLSNQVLRRVADCGGTLRITLYPYKPA
jgi:hypothetical protein